VLALVVGIIIMAGAGQARAASWPPTDLELSDLGSYEIYSMQARGKDAKPVKKRFLPETPRQALNADGLVGLFIAETADRLEPKRLFTGSRFEYVEFNSRYGVAYRGNEKGNAQTLSSTLNWIGEWAEWAVTVPAHSYSITAPRAYSKLPQDEVGLGNIRLAWKATYLPDRSYYRFGYGAVAQATTGNYTSMWPVSKQNDELKLFGCVTTQETEWTTGNLELGAILNSAGEDHRFIYRFGLGYEASRHATLIGELVGEIQGGDDRDTMDLLGGIRLSPTPTSVLEFSFTKNLRTYREFGWDDRLQTGFTIRW